MENWEMSWRQLCRHWRHRRCWHHDISMVGNPRCRQWHRVGIMMIRGLATPNAISDDKVDIMTAPGFQCELISTFANVAAAQAITDTHLSALGIWQYPLKHFISLNLVCYTTYIYHFILTLYILHTECVPMCYSGNYLPFHENVYMGIMRSMHFFFLSKAFDRVAGAIVPVKNTLMFTLIKRLSLFQLLKISSYPWTWLLRKCVAYHIWWILLGTEIMSADLLA